MSSRVLAVCPMCGAEDWSKPYYVPISIYCKIDEHLDIRCKDCGYYFSIATVRGGDPYAREQAKKDKNWDVFN